MSKSIKRDWRNWNPPSIPSKRSSPAVSEGLDIVGASGVDIKPREDKNPNAVRTFTVSATKKSLPTVKRVSNSQLQKLKLQHGEHFDARVERFKHHAEELLEWDDDFEYEINRKAAQSTFKAHIESKDKRLQGLFARMISKYAEDMVGEAIIGDDEWNMDELMLRSITRRNIYSCKQSREKSRIALVLDSSPSCQRESTLYHTLATLASKIGMVDIYLAPNARLTQVFNPKTKTYEKIFADLGLSNMTKQNYMSNYFKNRVIFFFGDYDGRTIINQCAEHNTIHWFNQAYDRTLVHNNKYRIYKCSNRDDLITIIKGIR